MQTQIKQQIKMSGNFDEALLQNWIIHRATLLDVAIEIQNASSSSIELLASGHPILVEALEIACSLGPLEASIEKIEYI